MMAIFTIRPNYLGSNQIKYTTIISSILPFNKGRTRAIHRIGPHNQDVLSIIICGMLGDWWGHKIKGNQMDSVRFNVEQGVKNSAYIHHLNFLLYQHGYCSTVTPQLVVKSKFYTKDKRLESDDTTSIRYNYRFTTHSFTSLLWIYNSFYYEVDGVKIKKVPKWVGEFITPLGLAHLVMSNGSLISEGLILKLNIQDIKELELIKLALKNKYNIVSSIISHTDPDMKGKAIKVLCIREEYIPYLHSIINSYLLPSLFYKFKINSLRSSKETVLSNDKVRSVAIYVDADTQKELIIRQNRGRAGVYCWINKLSGKSYVGSSVNLSKRFNQYYNYNHLVENKNMIICRALLKNGYSKFMVEILEFCDKSRLLEREQYYLDLLKPEYNILTKAGSSLGFKHSEDTILKMQKAKRTPENLIKSREQMKKLKLKPFSPALRARISATMAKFNVSTKGKKVVFTNIETNEKLSFLSFREAALKMKISRNTLKKYELSGKPYGIYKISFE